VLPPRPSVVPPVVDDEDDDDDDAPVPAAVVAQIYLQVAPADQPYWAVVQWQDAHGRWHDVTGWRGEVRGGASWWVAEKDFGKGPFRWALYPSGGPIVDQGGGRFLYRGEKQILAVSQPFSLPTRAGSAVGVAVSVPSR
jgi:hypothetical protein